PVRAKLQSLCFALQPDGHQSRCKFLRHHRSEGDLSHLRAQRSSTHAGSDSGKTHDIQNRGPAGQTSTCGTQCPCPHSQRCRSIGQLLSDLLRKSLQKLFQESPQRFPLCAFPPCPPCPVCLPLILKSQPKSRPAASPSTRNSS